MSAEIDPLIGIPVDDDAAGLLAWLARVIPAARALPASAAAEMRFLDGSDPHATGATVGPAFHRFVAAIYGADLACYPELADQDELPHLAGVLGSAAAGFRFYFVPSAGGPIPVGYTGFYAIAERDFRRLEGGDAAHRRVAPLDGPTPPRPFVHLYNYSIVAPLRKTAASRLLIRDFAARVEGYAPGGLSAFVVSEHGKRVARRFGMRESGTFQWLGTTEWIYTGRR